MTRHTQTSASTNQPSPIDLFAFLSILKQEWRTLFGAVVVASLAGFGYSLIYVPTFRSEALVLPASTNHIGRLVSARLGIGRTDPFELFDTVKRNFGSRNFQRDFLGAHFEDITNSTNGLVYSNSSPDGFNLKTRNAMFMRVNWEREEHSLIDRLLKLGQPNLSIDVSEDKDSNRPYLVIGVNWRNSVQSAQLADKFIAYVDKRSVDELALETQDAINLRISNIRDYIANKRREAQLKRFDLVTQLEEAATIAHSLDVELPIAEMSPSNIIHISPPPNFFERPTEKKLEPPDRQRVLPLYQPNTNLGNADGTLLYSPAQPLYARGWRALEAEAVHLRLRSDDDPYIPHLRALQQEIEWLSGLGINSSDIHLISVDQPTEIRGSPLLGPGYFWLIGALLGFLIGILVVILRHLQRHYSLESV
jgi:LPS O-antigen subunit length determinant protein (WzzB/FepE family)